MIAFKCDRCGVYYDKRDLSHLDSPAYAVNGKFIKLTDQYHNDVNLCPECYKKFISFMKNNTGYEKIEKDESMLEAYRTFRKDVQNAYEHCDDLTGELAHAISSIDYIDKMED